MIAWLLSLWLRVWARADDWICGTDCDPVAYDPEHPDEETW